MKLFILNIILFISLFSYSQTTLIINQLPSTTPADAHIYIAGDFNSWNPGDANYELSKVNGKYQIKLNLATGTAIKYKFTRGSWQTVEKGATGEEIANRETTIGNDDTIYCQIMNWADLSGLNSTATENVSIMDTMYIPQLDRYRIIRLYLPPGYDTASRSYPVIYMHDGQNLFDDATSYAGEWHVDESLNSLYNQGYPPVIVVGIDNGGAERINELTPWPNPEYGGGDGDKYVKFIIETLKPYVDSAYRTMPDRENTIIWGSSLGGLISLYAILKYPDVFGKAGVFSPSLWFNDSIYYLAAEADNSYKSKIYFLAGGKEGDGSVVSDCKYMINTLKNNSFPVDSLYLKENPNGTHSETFWSEEFPDAFKWLFKTEIPDNIRNINNGKVKIYPNPAKNLLHLRINTQEKYRFKIYDTTGRTVLTGICKNGHKDIDISNLQEGNYLLKVNLVNSIETKKFTIMRR